MARRLLLTSAIVAGLLVAAVIAYAAFVALSAPIQGGGNGTANVTETCSPGPCANVNGYVLWISNVHVTADVVRMTVKYQNSSSATHASPEDLELIDSSRHSSTPITGVSGCNTWTRHEFAHSGDTFGPIDVCFRVSNSTPPFTLRWSPDEGAFCCETDIKVGVS